MVQDFSHQQYYLQPSQEISRYVLFEGWENEYLFSTMGHVMVPWRVSNETIWNKGNPLGKKRVCDVFLLSASLYLWTRFHVLSPSKTLEYWWKIWKGVKYKISNPKITITWWLNWPCEKHSSNWLHLPQFSGWKWRMVETTFLENIHFQVIQAVTFLSPNVGGHQQPLKGSLSHPKKVTFAELPGLYLIVELLNSDLFSGFFTTVGTSSWKIHPFF